MNEFSLTVDKFRLDCNIEVEISEKLKDKIDQSIVHVLAHFEDQRSEIFSFLGNLTTSLIICDDEYMSSINSKHRSKDQTTDVLSFPLQESMIKGDFDTHGDIVALGDIIISHPVCFKQANESKLSYSFEFCHLFAHGLLHLIGLDHERSSEEKKKMFDLEDLLVMNGLE